MTLELGDAMSIPCEVSRGVFPDERRVSIDAPSGRRSGRRSWALRTVDLPLDSPVRRHGIGT